MERNCIEFSHLWHLQKKNKNKYSTLKFCVASFNASIGSRLYSSLFSEENYEDFCSIHDALCCIWIVHFYTSTRIEYIILHELQVVMDS